MTRRHVEALQKSRQVVVICNVVFDVTAYVSKHPGGKLILKAMSGDGFECMVKHHRKNWNILASRLRQTAVGILEKEERIPHDTEGEMYSLFRELFP